MVIHIEDIVSEKPNEQIKNVIGNRIRKQPEEKTAIIYQNEKEQYDWRFKTYDIFNRDNYYMNYKIKLCD